jgi:UDP-GlcNAc:undecaprenyl-phosphate GlcNAc-1-phosphate transferase
MPAALRLGRIAGLVDRPRPGGLKIHSQPISVLGGPAAILAASIALATTGMLYAGLALGVGLVVAIGLVDDARPVGPWPRLLATAAGAAIAVHPHMTGLGPLPQAVVSAVFGLACANAVNLVDGQDGLAGGMAAIAACSMGASAWILGVAVDGSIGLASGGALLGFLVWNRPPARIYLGNGGAYGIGVLLAVQAGLLVSDGARGFIVAFLCLGFFAFEVILTALRRLVSRASLMAGDRDHSYDVLAARMGSRTPATIALWGVGVGLAVVALLSALTPEPVAVAALLATVIVGILSARMLLHGKLAPSEHGPR